MLAQHFKKQRWLVLNNYVNFHSYRHLAKEAIKEILVTSAFFLLNYMTFALSNVLKNCKLSLACGVSFLHFCIELIRQVLSIVAKKFSC